MNKKILEIFPEGWDLIPSNKFCERVTDGTHDTPKPKSEGMYLLTSKNIKNGNIVYETAYKISIDDYNSINKRSRVDQWDVLFSMIGTVGEVAIVKDKPKFAIKNIGLFKCGNKTKGRWLYYFLTSSTGKKILDTYLTGTSQQFVSLGDLRQIPIICPPLPIQEKIAAVLSAYDELIENNNRRIAILEKMAEEIYREWFVRMRFPGHEKVKFHKGLPEGWELVDILNAFDFTGGGTPAKDVEKYWNNGDINWYTPSDITSAKGIYLFSSSVKCNEDGLRNSSAKIFPPYSIMMTSRATIGTLGINTTYACTNQGFITCIPNEKYPLVFLYHWLKLNKSYFEVLSSGATFSELIKSTFKKIKILTPPKNTIKNFQTLVDPIFKSIEKTLEKIFLLKKSRDLLLPRLISGKLSVEKLDIKFPPGMEETNA
ncbi:MAG: restriction endonuclease subunit S [Candidatus Aminicenantes bacterium]|nr:MAG: restriction endonuclease subunit S [Candidatus Aminicenantes bacterium]